jgi:site-specific DNA recombinase
MMLDKQMELSEYKVIKTRYEDKIRALEAEMQSGVSRPSDYKKYLDFGFNILHQVDEMYLTGSPFLKKQILCSMYRENLIFDENKYRTPVYHEALSLILNTVKGFNENEKGQNQNNLTLSFQVASTGIEP